ncbi:PH domain-containing protein [Nocardia lasii]|uniref:PH domain-containing protein n=1 Tax=Nocardia lasii TaxID=1616107 RepID=A0ABW1JM24_9NOCA
MGLLDGMMGNAGRIDPNTAQQEYAKLFGQGEQVYAAYILVRDAMLFTNRRLIMVDKQGVTGRKVSYHSIPYRSITHFAVETAGTFDLDAELYIWISSSPDPIKQRFNRQVDIYEVQGILSHYVSS